MCDKIEQHGLYQLWPNTIHGRIYCPNAPSIYKWCANVNHYHFECGYNVCLFYWCAFSRMHCNWGDYILCSTQLNGNAKLQSTGEVNLWSSYCGEKMHCQTRSLMKVFCCYFTLIRLISHNNWACWCKALEHSVWIANAEHGFRK